MSTGLQLSETTEQFSAPMNLGVADEVIAGLIGRLSGLEADTPAGYEMVKAGIAEVRTFRVGVENSRKKLKQSALAWGKAVDTEAKRVTAMLWEIEEPLKSRKAIVDDEKERIKQEKVEAIRKAQEAKELAAREEAERKERFEREQREIAEAAERERERKERAEERAKLDAERTELNRLRAEQAQRDRIEQERLDAERQKLASEREAIDAERREREDAERKRQAEAARVEREKQEAAARKEREEKEAEDRKQREEEAARIAEERKPDAVKLREFADNLVESIAWPICNTKWAGDLIDSAADGILEVANEMKSSIS